MVVTIIGGGHIGGACALGFASAGSAQVTVTARSAATLERFRGTQVRTSTDNAAAVRGADFVFLAVKTAQVPEALASIRDAIDFRRQVLVCLAAQVGPAELEAAPRLLYAIPNTAVEIGRGVTFLSDISAGPEALEALKGLFDSVGTTVCVPYERLGAGISLASCGAGYALKYIASAAKVGEQMGFTPEESARIVAQTVLGTSDLLMRGSCDPEADLRKVATPGGMTERGVAAMEEAGFDAAVEAGLKANNW
ncbi:MAG: NAD(P)-binding domain-containing protein [Bacteroidales bacterium]|nr:NAD(P)-binding domain-containing protein [Bacteroidales bacterium]